MPLNQSTAFLLFCEIPFLTILTFEKPIHFFDEKKKKIGRDSLDSFFFTDFLSSPEVQISAPTLQLKTYFLLHRSIGLEVGTFFSQLKCFEFKLVFIAY